MTPQEFFGDWFPYIDTKSMNVALSHLAKEKEYFPAASDVFRAFTMCKARDTVAVFLGQDPYPQKGVATGILFGNRADVPEDKLSPSLQVVKEAAINYEIPHRVLTFDNTLESWAKQGILMINSSLTVKPYTPGSHALYWRPFVAHFLKEFSLSNPGVVYVLFGRQAQVFKNYICPVSGKIIEVEHPAALARRNEKMPYSVFKDVQDYVYGITGVKLQWFHEEDYGEFRI